VVRDGDSPPDINILGTNEVSLAEKMSEPPREVLALIFVMSEPPREIDALIVVIDAPVSPSTPNGDTLTVEFSSSRYVVQGENGRKLYYKSKKTLKDRKL